MTMTDRERRQTDKQTDRKTDKQKDEHRKTETLHIQDLGSGPLTKTVSKVVVIFKTVNCRVQQGFFCAH